ncbi:TetR/AcrR family transcriptional regulator [Paenibacillus durus]|uniref:HTH tetR-type domain-containing protein n=1 Tax=Paenibacillus durus ATCC 35681 TaxID=1333534 RepID=A0A0F7FAI7_PAEDU|nr:TetR/AcrR family transcriptional regulator [Paenibacillus durus]AKG35598.1 hypothetical protein VK70_14295 [Paenibacillus durus ATCC 35681]
MDNLTSADFSAPSNRKDANKNTQRVLSAAHKLFADKGIEATMEEIASEAGVGVGTVQRRFSSKTRLAAAVVTDVFLKVKEKQLEVVQMAVPADRKMRLLFEIFSASHRQYGKIHSLGLHLATAGELGDDMKTSLMSGLEGGVWKVIIQGQDEGLFREGDPVLMELLIINMINPDLILKLNERIPADEIPKCVTDMILLGLTRR